MGLVLSPVPSGAQGLRSMVEVAAESYAPQLASTDASGAG